MQSTEYECPLCMEQLEIDDVNFFPCTCGYQICRFCWHRIRTDENGLCPACRKPYSEDPAVYTPLSQDEIQRILKERKQKDVQRKQKVTENRKHLANVRVVQKNLVFVVGLTQRLADPELLKRPEYFSKFGKIHKIVVNNSTNYAGPQGPSASAYITYAKEEDAIQTIIAVSNTHLDGRMLKASLGTTKYCSYFLRNTPCPKPDCMYLHELGDGAGSFTKEDMQAGKHQEYEQQLIQFYSRKMELIGDKEPKEDWPGSSTSESTEATSLPSRASWAGKGDSEDVENDDHLIPACKENWEHPGTSAVLVAPNHRLPTMQTRQQSKQFTKSLNSTEWEKGEQSSQGLESASGLFSGDLCSGLGLSNLHLKVYEEDDLGFDPWNECSKGLADLLQEEEKKANPMLKTAYAQNYLSSFQRDGNDIRNWQDGLRALLPNINISFSDSLLSRQRDRWPSTTSHGTETRSSNWSTSTQQPQGSWQVRPPPGFECKSPTGHMPMVDDPSILWSKTVNTDDLQIKKTMRRPFPNGLPGMHPLTRTTDIQGPAAASSKNKLRLQSADKTPPNIGICCSEENRKPCTRNTEEALLKGESETMEACQRKCSLSGYNIAQDQKTRVSELSVIELDDSLYPSVQNVCSFQDDHQGYKYLADGYQGVKRKQQKYSREEVRGKKNENTDKQIERHSTAAGRCDNIIPDLVVKQTNNSEGSNSARGISAPLLLNDRKKDCTSSSAEREISGNKCLGASWHQATSSRPAYVIPQSQKQKSLIKCSSKLNKKDCTGSTRKENQSFRNKTSPVGFLDASAGASKNELETFLKEANLITQNTH